MFFFQLKDFYLLIKDKEGELKEWYQFNFRYSSTVLQENKVSRNALYDQTKRLFDDIKNLSFYPKWDNNDVNIRAEIVYNNNGANAHISWPFCFNFLLF